MHLVKFLKHARPRLPLSSIVVFVNAETRAKLFEVMLKSTVTGEKGGKVKFWSIKLPMLILVLFCKFDATYSPFKSLLFVNANTV